MSKAREIAEEIWGNLPASWNVSREEFAGHMRAETIIQQALDEERERCAEIAENVQAYFIENEGLAVGQAIAKAIREQGSCA